MHPVQNLNRPVSIWCYVALFLGGATWALAAYFVAMWPFLERERIGILMIPVLGMPGAVLCSWTVPKDAETRGRLWKTAMWLNYVWPLLIVVMLVLSAIGQIF